MSEQPVPQGEFHHFQLVNTDGEVPISISVLVHYNNRQSTPEQVSVLGTNDVIAMHDALEHFDGDYIKAFKTT